MRIIMWGRERWRLIVWTTALWSILTGVLLLLYPTNVSTVTWHADMLGVVGIISGVLTLLTAEVWRTKHPPMPYWWVGLGSVLGCTAMRIPMAISQAHDDQIPWAQALNISLQQGWTVVVVLGLWANLVVPGARDEKEWGCRGD